MSVNEKTTPAGTEIVEIDKKLKESKTSIFQGLSFDSKPVSFAEYVDSYSDYIKRCTGI